MEQQGIILRNIDLTGISKVEQYEKVNEEKQELIEATKEYLFRGTKENKNHVIEEYFDLIQSALGLLDKFGISADEVMMEYPKHLLKLTKRPREKECKKCIEHSNCKLYYSKHWIGEKEAESCKIYKEQEE